MVGPVSLGTIHTMQEHGVKEAKRKEGRGKRREGQVQGSQDPLSRPDSDSL